MLGASSSVGGVRGVLGVWQRLKVPMGQKGYRGIGGSQGCRGCWRTVMGVSGASGGVEGVLGWQVDWEPNHIRPQSRVPALPLVPLGV